jgi:RNA polymerase sigma-70 factor (ECF subfamily)
MRLTGTQPADLVAGQEPVAATDEALLERLRTGAADEAGELVRRYQAPLTRYLQRLTGSAQLAEELHQQTWLRVLEHAGQFCPGEPGGFRSWLYRIATNLVCDHWRAQSRERAGRAALRLVVEATAPAAGLDLEAGEQAGRLRQALELLPQAQRQVIWLRYAGGLKFAEIAAVLGCPLSTALGRMHKALGHLRELLDVEVKS